MASKRSFRLVTFPNNYDFPKSRQWVALEVSEIALANISLNPIATAIFSFIKHYIVRKYESLVILK